MRRLIRNATILTLDPDTPDLGRGDILIDGATIAAIGPDLDAAVDEVIDASGRIAMPGFVNAHIHTWQTGLRGIAADWTLMHYLRAMHAGLATHFTAADVGLANRVGALHQMHAGVTTIADWCHNNPTPDHTDAAVEGLVQSGIRAVFLHGSPKPDPKPGAPHFSEVPMPRSEVERLRTGPLSDRQGLVTPGLAILGPCMSVRDVVLADFALAKEMGQVVSMHVAGQMMWPEGFQVLAAEGLLGPHVNIVHGNLLSDADLAILCDAGATFTVTPEVEMQMGHGPVLTNRVLERGLPVSAGSDVESAMAGEMFGVARFTLQAARYELTLRARTETGKPAEDCGPSARDALGWVTLEGARMLGMGDRTGSLAVGKAADIQLIDARGINMRPVHDPAASVLFHANARDVETVLVAGEPKKRDGALVEDPTVLLDELEDSGRRIVRALQAAG